MGSHPFFSRNITSEVSVLCSCVGASFRKLIARRSCTPLRRTCSTSTRASTQFLTCAPPSSRHGMAWQLFDIAECVWLRRCSVWLLSLHLVFLRRVYQGSPSLQPSATSTVSTRLETWCWSPRFCRTTPRFFTSNMDEVDTFQNQSRSVLFSRHDPAQVSGKLCNSDWMCRKEMQDYAREQIKASTGKDIERRSIVCVEAWICSAILHVHVPIPMRPLNFVFHGGSGSEKHHITTVSCPRDWQLAT